jgi:hypothetical protein
MKNNKIAIILPYFGKWPKWIDMYFYSCSINSDIDYFFYTDCEEPKHNYQNLYFNFYSFSDYCSFVSDKLSIEFKPLSAYKLCDLKPFYGFIHKDEIQTYDFWGFGDIDLVFGEIQNFYSDKIILKYDILSTHSDRLSGHFALFRNTERNCNICFNIINWKEKLLDNEYVSIDENDMSNYIYPESVFFKKIYSKLIRRIFNWRDAWVIYYNIMNFVNNFTNLKGRRLYFKEQHTTPILGTDGRSFQHDSDEWLYKEGKVFNVKNNKEYIYLHFMIYKKNSFREEYFWKENFYNLPDSYDFSKGVKINKNGFFPINE